MSPTRRELLIAGGSVVLAGCLGPRGGAPLPVVKSAAPRAVRSVHAFQASRDGAGVALRRVLGHRGLADLDPFLLLDEIRSDRQADFIAGFPEHPHRGFETVSYLLGGAFEHRDSVGNSGRIGAGATQWMTAGRGILHEEMPKQDDGQLLWGFQLWVNLPAAEKMIRPRYQELAATDIPELDVDGAWVRLVAGELAGRRGPVDGVSVRPLMFDATLAAGATLRQPVPGEHNAFAYVMEGAARLGPEGREVPAGNLAVFGAGDTIVADAPGGARLLVLAARPIREPIARRGPFVMNTDAELRQAFADYRAGRLAG
jgi:redox-sensitive bicupin YhaK (pirin superfamily)